VTTTAVAFGITLLEGGINVHRRGVCMLSCVRQRLCDDV